MHAELWLSKVITRDLVCQTPEFLCARPLRRGLGQGDRQWVVLELEEGVLRDLLGWGLKAVLCDVLG